MITLRCRLLKKSQIEACPVTSGLYIALKHRVSFATDLAHFGCNQFRIMPDIVFKLLRTAIMAPFEVAVLFHGNLHTPFSLTESPDFLFRRAVLHRP